MATSKKRALNISLGVEGYDLYKQSLEMLAADLQQSSISDLIRHIAEMYQNAAPELIAALTIAHQCAIGGDWNELIDFIAPLPGDTAEEGMDE